MSVEIIELCVFSLENDVLEEIRSFDDTADSKHNAENHMTFCSYFVPDFRQNG